MSEKRNQKKIFHSVEIFKLSTIILFCFFFSFITQLKKKTKFTDKRFFDSSNLNKGSFLFSFHKVHLFQIQVRKRQ